MTKLRMLLYSALPIVLFSAALPLQAEMYKYVDEKGRVTYSNKPIKGGKKVELPELSTVPAPRVESSAPARPAADDRESRRKVLQERIAEAEQALAAAKQAYQEGSEKPEVFRRPDGSIGRNVTTYEEKMKGLQADVDARQKALDDLKAELAALDAPAATIAPPAGAPGRTEEKK